MSVESRQNQNVLIVGSGGREDALAWKLRQTLPQKHIFIGPGNAGSHRHGTPIELNPESPDSIRRAAHDNSIDLVVVGPEVPLIRGVVNGLQEDGRRAFGPTKEAAEHTEGSKWAAIQLMQEAGIPHPVSVLFDTPDRALDFFRKKNPKQWVLKADGLAAGKGVVLPDSWQEVQKTIFEFMIKKIHGDAGRRIVVQERLEGEEVSIQAFSDGKAVVMAVPIQDHKRLLNDDRGPNTGGMGAFGPVSISAEKMEEYQKLIVQPLVDIMRKKGKPFKGRLYPGIIETSKGPKVLEFNCRFGDPETQVEMALLESDLLPILNACIDGNLRSELVTYRSGFATCVIMTANGYPGAYAKGVRIEGLDTVKDPNTYVFHAGTTMENGHVVTNGGRVLGVTAYASTREESIARANNAIGKGKVTFAGEHHRSDIGQRIHLNS